MAGIGLSRIDNPIFQKEAKMENSALELKNLIQGFKLSCQMECKSPKSLSIPQLKPHIIYTIILQDIT